MKGEITTYDLAKSFLRIYIILTEDEESLTDEEIKFKKDFKVTYENAKQNGVDECGETFVAHLENILVNLKKEIDIRRMN